MPDNKQCPSVGSNVYVGARYVPKMDGEWDVTKAYEPLTIVTWKGDSYTSRTWVAPGIEPSNETYWAQTGNYNAQVEEYRQLVLNLQQQTQENSDAIADNEELIDKNINDIADLKHRTRTKKWIFIGDSYALPEYGGWPEAIGKLMGLTKNVDYWIVSQGGSSFRSGSWLQRLKSWVASNPVIVPNIDYILCVGGGNDGTTSDPLDTVRTELVAAMREFNEYVKQTFPNGSVLLSFSARSLPGSSVSRTPDSLALVQKVWSDQSLHGMRYLTGIEAALWRPGAMLGGSDYLHPSKSGGEMLNWGLYNVLTCGNNSVRSEDVVMIRGDKISVSGDILAEVVDMRVYYSGSLTITFTDPLQLTANPVKIGTWTTRNKIVSHNHTFVSIGTINTSSTSTAEPEIVIYSLVLEDNGDVTLAVSHPKNNTEWSTFTATRCILRDLHKTSTVWQA